MHDYTETVMCATCGDYGTIEYTVVFTLDEYGAKVQMKGVSTEHECPQDIMEKIMERPFRRK